MRIISQDGSIDIDYNGAVFMVEANGIIASVNGKEYDMAVYSTRQEAVDQLLKLSQVYGRYFITFTDTNKLERQMLTEELEIQPELEFEPIKIERIENIVYRFPE